MNQKLSKPYPHYCAVHNLYYGSPTDTIPASMCPLCGIKTELLAQPAPRTYEVARALSWCDAVENSVPSAPQGWQQGAEKLLEVMRIEQDRLFGIGEAETYGQAKGVRWCADNFEAFVKRHQEGK